MSESTAAAEISSGYEQGAEQSGEQYLTFLLAGEEYGVDILRVQEIKGLEKVTEIPNTPDFILGVINLRGTVIPVIDMRLRFGMERREYTKLTVVIVVKVELPDRELTLGFVVDTVSDVYSIAAESIEPSPDFGVQVDTTFVAGIASVDDKMVILLDIDNVASNLSQHLDTTD